MISRQHHQKAHSGALSGAKSAVATKAWIGKTTLRPRSRFVKHLLGFGTEQNIPLLAIPDLPSQADVPGKELNPEEQFILISPFEHRVASSPSSFLQPRSRISRDNAPMMRLFRTPRLYKCDNVSSDGSDSYALNQRRDKIWTWPVGSNEDKDMDLSNEKEALIVDPCNRATWSRQSEKCSLKTPV